MRKIQDLEEVQEGLATPEEALDLQEELANQELELVVQEQGQAQAQGPAVAVLDDQFVARVRNAQNHRAALVLTEALAKYVHQTIYVVQI